MPYLLIILFLAFLPLPIFLAEALFVATGSDLSVFDGSGVGQVTPILIVLAMVPLFSRYVAKDAPFGFLDHYRRHWRRALYGFAIFAGITLVLSISAYTFFWLTGKVTVSADDLAALNAKVLEETLVAFIIVTVVAFTEEVIFRTFLMRYLRWNTSVPVTVAAVLVSTLIFTLSHHLEDPMYWFRGDGWKLFAGLYMLGVLLCVTYLVTGSFLCNVGIHAGLLYTEAFRYKTQLIDLKTDAWWLSPTYDVRLAPILWFFFACGAVAIYLNRHRLYAAFALERPVVHRGLIGAQPSNEPRLA